MSPGTLTLILSIMTLMIFITLSCILVARVPSHTIIGISSPPTKQEQQPRRVMLFAGTTKNLLNPKHAASWVPQLQKYNIFVYILVDSTCTGDVRSGEKRECPVKKTLHGAYGDRLLRVWYSNDPQVGTRYTHMRQHYMERALTFLTPAREHAEIHAPAHDKKYWQEQLVFSTTDVEGHNWPWSHWGVDQYVRLRLLTELVSGHMESNGLTFDSLLRGRLDCVLLSDLRLDEMDPVSTNTIFTIPMSRPAMTTEIWYGRFEQSFRLCRELIDDYLRLQPAWDEAKKHDMLLAAPEVTLSLMLLRLKWSRRCMHLKWVHTTQDILKLGEQETFSLGQNAPIPLSAERMLVLSDTMKPLPWQTSNLG